MNYWQIGALILSLVCSFWLGFMLGYEKGWYHRCTNKKHFLRER